jgi:hypothetical protein
VDSLYHHGQATLVLYAVSSQSGLLVFVKNSDTYSTFADIFQDKPSVAANSVNYIVRRIGTQSGINAYNDGLVSGFIFPHWMLILGFVIAGTLPWLIQDRWRFSVRIMLIAMTLIAVVLVTILSIVGILLFSPRG